MIILAILGFIVTLGFSFFVIAGLSWVVCWALAVLGVATIVWSWKLALAVWAIYEVFYIVFGGLLKG